MRKEMGKSAFHAIHLLCQPLIRKERERFSKEKFLARSRHAADLRFYCTI